MLPTPGSLAIKKNQATFKWFALVKAEVSCMKTIDH